MSFLSGSSGAGTTPAGGPILLLVQAGGMKATGIRPSLSIVNLDIPLGRVRITATLPLPLEPGALFIGQGVLSAHGLAPSVTRALHTPLGHIRVSSTRPTPTASDTLFIHHGVLHLHGFAPVVSPSGTVSIPLGLLRVTGYTYNPSPNLPSPSPITLQSATRTVSPDPIAKQQDKPRLLTPVNTDFLSTVKRNDPHLYEPIATISQKLNDVINYLNRKTDVHNKLLIKDTTIGNDIADRAVTVVAGNTIKVRAVLRKAITKDLIVRTNIACLDVQNVLITIKIPKEAKVNQVFTFSQSTKAKQGETAVLTADIKDSDGQVDDAGIAQLSYEWVREVK